MNMKTKFNILFLLISFNLTYSQIKITEKQQSLVHQISQEKIFIHYNSNFLVTGETLYYKFYCLNVNTNINSTLSKVAYLELVDTDKKTILKQKIQLKNGIGFGDLFIDNKYKTGNYKLIAYTEWMKNKNSFYTENVHIYNAFTTPPKLTETSSNTATNKTIQKLYGKREKVTFPLNLNNGTYSVSVKKVAPKSIPQKMTAENFISNFKRQTSTSSIFYIPEFRGEVLTGKVTTNNTSDNLANLKIGLSIKDKNGYSKISSTNKDGVFYFVRNEAIENDKLFLQVLTDSIHKYNIQLLKKTSPNYSSLKFPEINFIPEIRKEVNQRSIYLQVENAYKSQKQDIIIKPILDTTFFQKNAIQFHLDDYKRFNTMKETLVEVIESAWVSENKGSYTFHIRDEDLDNNNNFKSLVLIDGYIINNHNLLAEFHPKKIKAISVFRKKYILNSVTYQGVFYIETFGNSFVPNQSREGTTMIKGLNYTPKKHYYKQKYITKKSTRIPDYRTQLSWNPDINETKQNLTFYTSDVTGVFEISIEGFTNEGKPISIKTFFEVK